MRKKNDFRITDNLVAYSAISNIRNFAKEYMMYPRDGKKLFIARKNTSFFRIVNETEVAQLFRDNGYEIVMTEDLTYHQQVHLFSSAICVVGASGAALTNLVYCNPGTVFGCIIPKKYNFFLYSSIAYMNSCKELFLDAKVTRHAKEISSECYRVDMDECRQYIKKLDAMVYHDS